MYNIKFSHNRKYYSARLRVYLSLLLNKIYFKNNILKYTFRNRDNSVGGYSPNVTIDT